MSMALLRGASLIPCSPCKRCSTCKQILAHQNQETCSALVIRVGTSWPYRCMLQGTSFGIACLSGLVLRLYNGGSLFLDSFDCYAFKFSCCSKLNRHL